jgi:hypothetical protein
MKAPFEAYTGDEPYVFISYSHSDKETVYPDLALLQGMGYRIWYDEGIRPASEWPEEIAASIEGCTFFTVFISPNSVNSRNVRNEISFALDNRKPLLRIHIEETLLSPGLKLQMGNVQAIFRYQLDSGSYLRRLRKSITETTCGAARSGTGKVSGRPDTIADDLSITEKVALDELRNKPDVKWTHTMIANSIRIKRPEFGEPLGTIAKAVDTLIDKAYFQIDKAGTISVTSKGAEYYKTSPRYSAPELFDGLLSENRSKILSDFARIPDEEKNTYLDVLVQKLRDPSSSNRLAALFCLFTVPNPLRDAHLLLAVKDPSKALRRRAAFLIGETRSKDFLGVVSGLMNDGSPEMRAVAREAYRKITGRRP